MSAEMSAADSADLEQLFESVARAQHPPEPPLQSGFRLESGPDAHTCSAARVLNSVGHLTRQLHDTLAELGYDTQIHECAAATLPDARQRLAYVVNMTEQAASRSLNAVELATPMQEALASEASALSARWDALVRGESSVDEFKLLAKATRDYLGVVPSQTEATRTHLREIVMAQEFQDLTGQVLKRVTELASDLETQLLRLLVENTAAPVRAPETLALLDGPAIAPGGGRAVNQAQVDELLESLGF
jgi:chemotaxis protein CheZ